MDTVDLLFLGTGDAFNTDGLAHTSVWIKTDTLNLLVDAGPTTLLSMISLGLDPGELDYIFITHFHGDHTAGLPFIMLHLQKRRSRSTLPVIIGPKGIKECCAALFDAAYKDVGLGEGLTFKELEPKIHKNITINDSFTIDTYPMNHQPESLGYRFYLDHRVIAISGDTGFHASLLSLMDNTDAAIIECSTVQPILPFHMSVNELSHHLPHMNTRLIIPVHTAKEVLREVRALHEKKIVIVTDKMKVSI
ncbi:MAG: MBL fold metallo-hydrolase [Spirochaetales bacterium]|nr:MBL fold metallo-hydrolase [Spirochaetales bacterium]